MKRLLLIICTLSLGWSLSADLNEASDLIPIQVSFVPGVGIPFGYGDTGLALGIIGNLSRDVRGASIASVFSLARDVDGIQGSGVFNIARDVQGLQSAGVFNVATGDVGGMQLASVFNIAGGKVGGLQLSGVFNIAGGSVDGLQAAGLFDIAERYNGPLQLAGLFTIAGDLYGIQLAGLFTIADRVRGAQISPIVNIAGRVTGVQAGLINIADSIEGLQIGLVNIARNGIGGVGVLYDIPDNSRWYHWQSGSPALYMILSVEQFSLTKDPWGVPAPIYDSLPVSFGLGSRVYFGKASERTTYLDIDLDLNADFGSLSEAIFTRSFGSSIGEIWTARPKRLWPSTQLSVGIPFIWRLHGIVGVRVDGDIVGWEGMPARTRTGLHGSLSLGSLSLDLYSKVFFGFRF
ncbi:MAG: hypothetical protein ACOYM2_06980 [Rectinemataceae bacterium]